MIEGFNEVLKDYILLPCAVCGRVETESFAMFGIGEVKGIRAIKICRDCDGDTISTYGR
jgi:hypothetical protein